MHLADVEPLLRTNSLLVDEISELAGLSARLHRPERRAYRLLAVGNQLLQRNALIPALDSLQAAIAAFDLLGRPIPWLLGDLRLLFNRLGYQEAKGVYYHTKLAEYRRRGAQENMAACCHGLAGYYMNKGDYNRATGFYLQASALYRTVMRYQSYSLLAAAGSVYAEWGNPERGLHYLRQAVALLGPRINAFPYLHLARIELRLHHYAAALHAITRCLAAREWGGMGPAMGKAHATLLKSAILLAQGHPNQARPLLQVAQHLADSLRLGIYDQAGNFELDATWARYYRLRGNDAQAEAHWLAAYQRARQSNIKPLQLSYLHELTRFYQQRRQPGRTAAYAVAALGLADTLRVAEGRLHVAQYEIEEATRAQTARIATLRERQQQDAARAHRQQTVLAIVLSGLVLLLGLAAALYAAFRRSQRLKRVVIRQKLDLQTQRDQLDHSLTELQRTQAQLIQREKMASLGELTAGVAHEIQNPLNFVNNFSEVSTELLDELDQAQHRPDRDPDLEEELLDDLKQNLHKINQHGQRAAGIVRGMLEHSRQTTGERTAVAINQLSNEYLHLAYRGWQAKNKAFAATLHTDFAPDLPAVWGVEADLGRVLVNLLTNAFHAVSLRQQQGNEPTYQPLVRVCTRQLEGQVEIRVSDNGVGIPAELQTKIFQPFFTTKSVGENIGLGLSLSYTIITQGHGGTLTVESEAGQETTFIVRLPVIGSAPL
ncbi:His Kinase A (phospho-acceptor) domain-containing protein [Hymenobacter daecheongensis DSM 21074]|uniref:histidine kinase n=1 Tax=Hymenobacter daecheongensis DSM 21074 TaxID=1121955 RepID=A0A1M6D288_9BACT|nr:ATP-binding protein [Hymenobacter daecheongensis]SHI67309.1 His Kinase A (phospho-acceptor) domain-containing protein [Hymenobacter daecheongensis DSM 21074]